MLKATAKGEVDVLVGTHRLLSKDVAFSDLGLVIIDEEQRFGVEHKQRLLELRVGRRVGPDRNPHSSNAAHVNDGTP